MDRADLDLLIAKYVDGDCTQAEAETLFRELDSSDEARARLAQCLYHEQSIAEALTACDKSKEVSKRLLATIQRQRNTRWRVAALAACAGVAVLVYLFMQAVNSSTGGKVDDSPAVAGAIAMIETIERNAGAKSPPAIFDATGQKPASISQHILSGARIETGNATVRLAFMSDGTRLELKSDTVLTLELRGGAKFITMDRGELTAIVAKQPTGMPMQFATPQATAEVVGTKLHIQTDLAQTELSVSEGAVRFRNHFGESILVHSGERHRFGDASSAAANDARRIAFWDFETPPEPRRFRGNRVPVPEDAQNGSRFCMKSWLDSEYRVEAIDWEDSKPIFAYADGLELEFDLYTQRETPQLLDACLYNIKNADVFVCDIKSPPVRTWTHIRLPLRDFYSKASSRERIPAGSEFTSVRIQSATGDGQFLLIDNLRLGTPSSIENRSDK